MSNPLINPTIEIIPVNLAIAKTANWRQFMQDAAPDALPATLPKGVYISRNDLIDLANYCTADDTILGVRAYFTLENDHRLNPGSNNVKFIMVLVQDSPEHFNGKDLLRIPVGVGMQALSPDDGAMNDSNIYDFTQPCPDCCDPSSELYDVQPPSSFRRKAK